MAPVVPSVKTARFFATTTQGHCARFDERNAALDSAADPPCLLTLRMSRRPRCLFWDASKTDRSQMPTRCRG
jgi:hypothetical protein